MRINSLPVRVSRALLTAGVIALTGCGSGSDPAHGRPVILTDGPVPVRSVVPPPLDSPGYPFMFGWEGPRLEVQVVVRSMDEWLGLWDGEPPAFMLDPDVDFAQEMLLVVAVGERLLNESLRIESATVTAGTLRVKVRELVPGSATLPMVTHPWAAAAVPRADNPVEFTVEIEQGDPPPL